MTGTYPTVGCPILIERAHFISVERVLQALQPFARLDDLRPTESGPSLALAEVGGTALEAMVTAQEMQALVAVRVEFDEDAVVQVVRATGTPLEQLFSPYVQAAKTIPGVVAAGIGFELSAPADLQEHSLKDAGVAVMFARDEEHKSWSRKQTAPLVGHYLWLTGEVRLCLA